MCVYIYIDIMCVYSQFLYICACACLHSYNNIQKTLSNGVFCVYVHKFNKERTIICWNKDNGR